MFVHFSQYCRTIFQISDFFSEIDGFLMMIFFRFFEKKSKIIGLFSEIDELSFGFVEIFENR